MSKKTIFFFSFLLLFFLLSPTVYARTTPEDIANAKRESYNQKVKNYSSQSKQKLENLSKKISEINQLKTQELELITTQQSLILDEYIRRTGYQENGGSDGINRDLTKPVEKARYWITFAHEAVAYQAAKNYIFELSSEINLKSDATNLVSLFQSDLNSTKQKVINSQKILDSILPKE